MVRIFCPIFNLIFSAYLFIFLFYFCCLNQAISEDPDDAIQWNQLGMHSLCTQQFKTSQKYLKASVARLKECSYAWSNLGIYSFISFLPYFNFIISSFLYTFFGISFVFLGTLKILFSLLGYCCTVILYQFASQGISLQLSEESPQAEEVYKRALLLATAEQAHAIFSNLGNLYRQQKKYERAKAMFTKSLELQPGYAPAFNNLGLVFVAEGRWEEAKYCFNKALEADPLLDAAKSNMIKAAAMCRVCTSLSSCLL